MLPVTACKYQELIPISLTHYITTALPGSCNEPGRLCRFGTCPNKSSPLWLQTRKTRASCKHAPSVWQHKQRAWHHGGQLYTSSEFRLLERCNIHSHHAKWILLRQAKRKGTRMTCTYTQSCKIEEDHSRSLYSTAKRSRCAANHRGPLGTLRCPAFTESPNQKKHLHDPQRRAITPSWCGLGKHHKKHVS